MLEYIAAFFLLMILAGMLRDDGARRNKRQSVVDESESEEEITRVSPKQSQDTKDLASVDVQQFVKKLESSNIDFSFIDEMMPSAKPYTNTQSAKNVQEFITQRGIKKLLHFTAGKNIGSIKKYGILSVAELERRGWYYSLNDSKRLDFKLDYISLSISRINSFVCKRFIENGSLINPYVIEIDPCVLWQENLDKIYCITNAATKNASKGSSLEDLKAMFANDVSYIINGEERKVPRKNKNFNETTDPQAEILFEKRIDPKYFLNIYPLKLNYDRKVDKNDFVDELPF